ncbi:hypothetical protein NJB1907f44_35210 [Mycobacterium marinum]|uniref:hypothetical protein n=1 Tax=Mycobacterium marinum TaxID=1781 RepID=UPI000E3E2BFF|nr:hypothetical protein [Mycobacterium marinum]RFZ39510.1 2-haloacid dehalogenase, configuration-inverting [Mycobacterium marinum]GJO02340.1 hypothetical protein NJB1907f34b_20640 [Mycobacterium marinum]GJO08107.1 hypothetical protein NJB1907E90_22450 [Mycobacterium marinum]GJO22079.1 hypothetical protein NJB1728e18_24290 [Mycobacterium marinum]GJO27679.1 hypothetical protein NJB1907E11_44650 [Mycobacterium marinum]
MQPSGDPVPSVGEAEATGEIAELYADIRETLGMSFVNLIWRNIASIPGGLRWTWETMKPLYTNGAVYGQADALREAQDLPTVPRFSRAALRSVGINAEGESAIRAALIGYDRGNPLNIVSFSAILARLDGQGQPAAPPGQQPPRHGAGTPAPTRLNFDQMPSHVAEMVRTVNLIGARGKAKEVQVSLPRNLAHWPGFLVLYYAALRPLHDDGSLLTAIDAVLADGRRRGVTVSGALGPTELPDPETAAAVKDSLENLVPNAMGRMIPVVSLLLNMMPTE